MGQSFSPEACAQTHGTHEPMDGWKGHEHRGKLRTGCGGWTMICSAHIVDQTGPNRGSDGPR
jgi:hypothetical protein